jgi:curved DNA-binding protein CbpA
MGSSHLPPRNNRKPDYYELLGVAHDATFREIEAAYWRAVRERRDLVPLLNEAYEVLGDPERRAAYNATRRAKEEARPPTQQAAAGSQKPLSGNGSRLGDKLRWNLP